MSYQDRAQHQLSQLDKELSKYQALNNLEAQTSIPKVYLALGFLALYFFLVFFNIGGEVLVNTAGFAIPAYYSLNALFTPQPTDDIQWLTYWVTYSFLTVIESAINAVYWFPFYYTFKFVLVLWMSLPQTGGAQLVFRSLIQPMFSRYFQGPVGSASSGLRGQAESVTKHM